MGEYRISLDDLLNVLHLPHPNVFAPPLMCACENGIRRPFGQDGDHSESELLCELSCVVDCVNTGQWTAGSMNDSFMTSEKACTNPEKGDLYGRLRSIWSWCQCTTCFGPPYDWSQISQSAERRLRDDIELWNQAIRTIFLQPKPSRKPINVCPVANYTYDDLSIAINCDPLDHNQMEKPYKICCATSLLGVEVSRAEEAKILQNMNHIVMAKRRGTAYDEYLRLIYAALTCFWCRNETSVEVARQNQVRLNETIVKWIGKIEEQTETYSWAEARSKPPEYRIADILCGLQTGPNPPSTIADNIVTRAKGSPDLFRHLETTNAKDTAISELDSTTTAQKAPWQSAKTSSDLLDTNNHDFDFDTAFSRFTIDTRESEFPKTSELFREMAVLTPHKAVTPQPQVLGPQTLTDDELLKELRKRLIESTDSHIATKFFDLADEIRWILGWNNGNGNGNGGGHGGPGGGEESDDDDDDGDSLFGRVGIIGASEEYFYYDGHGASATGSAS